MSYGKKHPALNQIKAIDKFRVVAYNLGLDMHMVFQVVGDRDNLPAQFNCATYDSGSLSHPAYYHAATVPRDGHVKGMIRSHAVGLTLDELVYNLDWAHLPSELALLRALLSTRVTTNDGTPVGDLVLRRLSDEHAKQLDETMTRRAREHAVSEQTRIREETDQAVSRAIDDIERNARFGLCQTIAMDIDPKLA